MKLLYLILVLVIIVYILLIPRKTFLLEPIQIQTFYNDMEKVAIILEQNNIPYFAICGTLLGITRHREMFRWDDDIDIGILDKDIDKYNSIDFKKYGYESDKISRDGKYCCGKIYLDTEKKLYIDVFPFEKVDNKYIYKEERARNLWPNEYFYEDELFPLKKYEFGTIKIYSANNPIPYCERAWGKNTWKRCTVRMKKFITDPIISCKILFSKTNPIV